jgi:hypothetical protein
MFNKDFRLQILGKYIDLISKNSWAQSEITIRRLALLTYSVTNLVLLCKTFKISPQKVDNIQVPVRIN